jgi:hypothetical protein
MNSIQLAQRLARNLAVEDVFNLEDQAALDVLAAMNAGIGTFYREMPGIYKRTTLSCTLRSPRTLSVVFNAKYSNRVADDSFETRDMGCTIRFNNGAADSIVTASNAVLDDYLMDALSTDATIYSDVVPLQDVIERVIGAVRLYSATKSEPTPLIRDERLRGGRARRWMPSLAPDEIVYPFDAAYLSEIGRPRYYYLDPVGSSQGGEPEFLLRVAPMPDTDYTVRMEAELSTERIVFADLKTARAIYVADAYIEDILVPLCEAELVTSKFWRDARQQTAVVTRAQNVLANKMPKIPTDVAPTSNGVGRPWGY